MKRKINGVLYTSSETAYEALKPPVAKFLFRKRWTNVKLSNRGVMKPRSTTKGSFNVDGKIYSTLRKAYDDIKPDISYSGFVGRYERGIRGKALIKSAKPDPIVIDGKEYATVKSAYEILKPPTSLHVFRSRAVYNHWTKEQFMQPKISKINERKA